MCWIWFCVHIALHWLLLVIHLPWKICYIYLYHWLWLILYYLLLNRHYVLILNRITHRLGILLNYHILLNIYGLCYQIFSFRIDCAAGALIFRVISLTCCLVIKYYIWSTLPLSEIDKLVNILHRCPFFARFNGVWTLVISVRFFLLNSSRAVFIERLW